MSWPAAAAGDTSIETATRALDLLDVSEGATLLIEGAVGGVGSVAVQLAIGRHGLTTATTLFEKGAFHVPLREVFPLAQIARAHTLATQPPRQGKVVLTIP